MLSKSEFQSSSLILVQTIKYISKKYNNNNYIVKYFEEIFSL